jgi:hypothetical protein
MHYCEAHKDKAPTREQYEAFMSEKLTPKSRHYDYFGKRENKGYKVFFR